MRFIRWKMFGRYLFMVWNIVFLTAAAVLGWFTLKMRQDLPSYERLAEYEPPVLTRVHAGDGALLQEFGREKRVFVPISAVPKHVQAAVLAAEDPRFEKHGGVDPIAMVRFAIEMWRNGRSPHNASTITQKVAKAMLLSQSGLYARKVSEALLAVRMEDAYNKDKILELFINEVYFGLGYYGIAAASLNYFNKELKDLTIAEAAYLGGVLRAPNSYHPFRRTKEAKERRDWVIDQMQRLGRITAAEAQAAKAEPFQFNRRPTGVQVFSGEYFSEEVRRTLVGQWGEDKLYGGGLSVRTSLDPAMQRRAKAALVEGLVAYDRDQGFRGPIQRIDVSGDWGIGLARVEVATDLAPWRLGVVLEIKEKSVVIGLSPTKLADGTVTKEREAVEIPVSDLGWMNRRFNSSEPHSPRPAKELIAVGDVYWVTPKDGAKPEGAWSIVQYPDVNGAIVVMDPHTGRVLALSGGFSFDVSTFDRALQGRRQPGTAFLPILIAAALDNSYRPTSIILAETPKAQQSEVSFRTLRTVLERPSAAVTRRLAEALNMPLVVEYARRMGVYEDLEPRMEMALGQGETTLLRLVGGYATFVNGGRQIQPTLIDRIQDRWGKIVWRHDQRLCEGCKSTQFTARSEPELPDDRRQVMDPHTAFQVVSMFNGSAGDVSKEIGDFIQVGGVNGVSDELKDAWYIGFTADLIVGVFIGHDTPKPMANAAVGLPRTIFNRFVQLSLDSISTKKQGRVFRQPPGIQQIWVNKDTGLRASRGTPTGIAEYFKPGEAPDAESSMLYAPGTYSTSCVRLCDGAHFPISMGTPPGHFERDNDVCQSKCAAPAELYYSRVGEGIETARSFKTQTPYVSLRTAFRNRKEHVPGCSCKGAEFTTSGANAPYQTPVERPSVKGVVPPVRTTPSGGGQAAQPSSGAGWFPWAQSPSAKVPAQSKPPLPREPR